ncbi:hypothetical protein [Glutamicibacter sp.]|uniref:hypothetical protein n=1 Tax=Glutamicibacter sp. TaxID=1931995 RepID=UPI002FE4223E
MSYSRPPYIGAVRIQEWITKDKQRIQGIRLIGASGIAAHLTAREAIKLADKLVDLAEQLNAPKPTPAKQPATPREPYLTALELERLTKTVHVSRTLTAADGTPEQRLPATPAD